MKNNLPTQMMALALLSSCTLAPEYIQPELPVEQNWPRHEKNSNTSKHISCIGWKDFFMSPPLQDIIQTALDHNRDLRVASLNIEAAQAQYRIERAGFFPQIGFQGNEVRQKITKEASKSFLFGSGISKEFTTSQYNANIGITAFELDLFGKIRSLNDAALETYFATKAAQKAMRISLIAQVANGYLQLLADQKLLQLTEETLIAQEKSYEMVAKSQKKGAVSKLDLARARTMVETARANKALFMRHVEQDKNALVSLMGNENKEILSEDTILSDIKIMDNLPVGLPSDVLLSRPDILQAEHHLKSANANIGAARAAFFPTISLTGTYGFASSDLSHLFSNGAAGAWTYTPLLTLPIFAGGRNISNLDLSHVRKNIAVAEYEKSIQTAFREVSDELIARETLIEQQQAQTELVKASQSAYDLSYARYKQGIDSLLSVLDAQRSLYAAQQGAIDIEKQKIMNLVNLYKALGGGID